MAEAQTIDLRIKALAEQSAQLDAQMLAAQRDADAKAAALAPQLAALSERVKALAAIEAQLAALLQGAVPAPVAVPAPADPAAVQPAK